ncbi:MAG: hypothetical protein ABII01_01380 [Candidatus Woesearchaeota archaeon]
MADLRKIIEFICTANHGRSPVAEMIAANYLRAAGAQDLYQAASSGTLVDSIEAGTENIEAQKRFVQMGLERGDVYDPEQADELNEALRDGNDDVVSRFYPVVKETFHAEEHAWRAEALKYFRIDGEVKDHSDQTVINPRAVAVLSMDPGNNQRARKIYEEAGCQSAGGNRLWQPERVQTIADLLPRFATGNENEVVSDAFGKTKDHYFAAVEDLVCFVPKAVGKIVALTDL